MGRVVNSAGRPEGGVTVRIEQLSVGATTQGDGTYRIVIPPSRVRDRMQVRINASRAGMATASATITVSAGAEISQDFTLSSWDA